MGVEEEIVRMVERKNCRRGRRGLWGIKVLVEENRRRIIRFPMATINRPRNEKKQKRMKRRKREKIRER